MCDAIALAALAVRTRATLSLKTGNSQRGACRAKIWLGTEYQFVRTRSAHHRVEGSRVAVCGSYEAEGEWFLAAGMNAGSLLPAKRASKRDILPRRNRRSSLQYGRLED